MEEGLKPSTKAVLKGADCLRYKLSDSFRVWKVLGGGHEVWATDVEVAASMWLKATLVDECVEVNRRGVDRDTV